MTENKRFNDFRGYKRFDTYFDDYMQLWTVSDNENDNMLYPCTSENMANEFAKLLNELHEENQMLKRQYADDCNEANSLTVKIAELSEENEELKTVVKEVIELLSEEVDVFSDKATEHDINAYIELKELDNKDAYYMATATKKAIKLLRGIVDD